MPLPSGLQIAVAEDGDPDGIPVFFFHGWPASRLQGAGFGPAARQLGLRIVSPDRPGIGLSSYQPKRALLDWPPVVREIARQLGFDRFRILAVSGGGPYALACAYALPELVERVVVVSGAPPLGPDVDPKALLPVYRWLLAIHRHQPAVLRQLFHLARPFATLRPPRWIWPVILRFVPKEDRESLRDPAVFEGSFGCYKEAWRAGAHGVVSDAEIYGQSWGFAPQSIQVPVRLWHGKADASFSWHLAEALAAALPNCKTRFIEGEGHYSLPIRCSRAILEDLIAPEALIEKT
ncbi:MAG: alpha/beta hydrolase [Chthoniobacteraceae bacterium]|nr:alpha/beta hydrolase [Chthoniobacteraceae bacterium]